MRVWGGQGGGDGGPRDAVASYSRLLPPWKARALVPASIVCGAALADFDQVRIAGRPQRGLGLRQQLGALACRAWQGGCSVLGQAGLYVNGKEQVVAERGLTRQRLLVA